MSTNNHPYIHFHFFGDMLVAHQLIPSAKRIAGKLAMRNRNAIDSITDTIDGSVITVTRVNDQYSATIYGSKLLPKVTKPKVVIASSISVLAGYVTDPAIIGSVDAGAHEFSPCRQTRGDKPVVRKPEPKLSTRPTNTWGAGDENASAYSQAGYITPSMFSGKMCELVQLALALDGKITSDAASMQLLGVQYASSFGQTHGLVRDITSGEWYVVSISPSGVSLSNVMYVNDFPLLSSSLDKLDLPNTSFGKYPTGIVTAPFKQLLSAEDLRSVYNSACTPPIDPLIGWCFDDAGTECRLVVAYWDGSRLTSRVARIKFTISATSNIYNASLKLSNAYRLADPEPWWHVHKVKPWTAGERFVTENDNMVIYGGRSEYPKYMHQPLRHLFDWLDANIVGHPSRYTEGIDSSWFLLHPPITLWLRDKNIEGKRAYVKYPAITPKRNLAVDAPVHVTFHNGAFVTYQYFWTLDAPVSPRPFNDRAGLYGAGGSNGVYGLTWYQKQLCYGTPPTIYSNLKDTRERRAFLSAAIDPFWEYLATAQDADKDFTDPKKMGIEMFGYRTKTEWAFHSGLILPYMNREAVIETTFDSPGWARTKDGGKIVGSDFAVSFGPSDHASHIIQFKIHYGVYIWDDSHGADSIVPFELSIPAHESYNYVDPEQTRESKWALFKAGIATVAKGAKEVAGANSGFFPYDSWAPSVLTDAPSHCAVKDRREVWTAKRFVLDAFDYTNIKTSILDGPNCRPGNGPMDGAMDVTYGLVVVGINRAYIPQSNTVFSPTLPSCGFYAPYFVAARRIKFPDRYPILAEHKFIDYIANKYGSETFPRLFTMLATHNTNNYEQQQWWIERNTATRGSFPDDLARSMYRSKNYIGVYRSLWDDKSKAILKLRGTWGGGFKIPNMDRGEIMKKLCPDVMQGCGASASYIGDVAMFLRGDGIVWAHGAIPDGLVLEAEDVICMIGDIKNG